MQASRIARTASSSTAASGRCGSRITRRTAWPLAIMNADGVVLLEDPASHVVGPGGRRRHFLAVAALPHAAFFRHGPPHRGRGRHGPADARRREGLAAEAAV